MSQPIYKHWALLGYLILVWGFAFALIAVALESFHPVFIVWCRLWMGAVVVWGVWRWRGRAWSMGREWWPRLTLLSFTGNIIPFSLIAWAEQSVPSAEVGILMALMPIATLLLAHWLLEHEPLTWRRSVGVVMGFVGVGLLVGDDLLSRGASGQWPGQLATLLATVSYAFNGVYAKRIPSRHPVDLALGTLVVGSLLLAGPAVWLQLSGPGLARDGVGGGSAGYSGRHGHRRGDLVLFCCGDRTGTGISLDHQLSDSGCCLRCRHGAARRTLGLGASARAAFHLGRCSIDSGTPSRLITRARNARAESVPRRPRRDGQ